MRPNTSKNITVTMYGNYSNFTVATGSSVLSADIISVLHAGEIVRQNTVALKLTAMKPGVSTFTLLDNKQGDVWSAPAEVWIYDDDGKVPGISDTETYSVILGRIADGYGVSYDIPDEPDEPLPVEPVIIWRYLYDGETIIENEDSIIFSSDTRLNGLSVLPRFAVPQYPSDDVRPSMYLTLKT